MTTSQDFVTWSCSEALDPDFLMQALLAEGSDIRRFGNGSTHTTIYFPEVKAFHIALPPLTEQRRIVAKLDALDASSKRARADLDRIPALVARAKQAILEKAFRGELTSDFRRTHCCAAQSHAEIRLEIDDKRQEVWRSWQSEQNLKRSYKPPQDVDWTPGFELPEDWQWCSVDQLCAASQYGSSAKTNDDAAGVPVLRMGNIQDGKLTFTNLKFLPENHAEFPELMLKNGDLLFNRTNSPELVGKTAVFEGFSRPCSFASYLIRLRVAAYQPRLLAAYLNSSIGRLWVRSVVTQQVGQANVNGTKLAGLAVPFMHEDEQLEILRRIDSAFAKIDRIAAEAASASALLDRLDQALLSKAFRGELVPQDPADEPASELLARIQAARAAAPKAKRARRTKETP
jgi:type I restriction enzyme S subunit